MLGVHAEKAQPNRFVTDRIGAPGFSPVKFTPEKSAVLSLCGCKHSKPGHLCDGTHKSL